MKPALVPSLRVVAFNPRQRRKPEPLPLLVNKLMRLIEKRPHGAAVVEGIIDRLLKDRD